MCLTSVAARFCQTTHCILCARRPIVYLHVMRRISLSGDGKSLLEEQAGMGKLRTPAASGVGAPVPS